MESALIKVVGILETNEEEQTTVNDIITKMADLLELAVSCKCSNIRKECFRNTLVTAF